MISPHPGHGSKEVISNNAPSQNCKGREDFSSTNTWSFPGFCLAGKRPVRTRRIYLPSLDHIICFILKHIYVSVALKGVKGRVRKKCSVTANLLAQQRIKNHK